MFDNNLSQNKYIGYFSNKLEKSIGIHSDTNVFQETYVIELIFLYITVFNLYDNMEKWVFNIY